MMITRFKFVCVLLSGFLLLQTGGALAQEKQSEKPKYVFLMIGDGMGVGACQAAAKYKELTSPADPKLLIERLPVAGMTTTHPEPSGKPADAAAAAKPTDSAAAGTALACGVKTLNGMIGMTSDGKPQKSIAVTAKESGRKVAVISSVGLNHATPAAFYAHNKSRSQYDAIGAEIAGSGFDFFAGEPLLGKKPDDNRKLIKAAGYEIVNQRAAITAYDGRGKKSVLEHPLAYRADNVEGALRLADLVKLGLTALSDHDKGFFMMVEGGKIDWAGHANDIGASIGETLEFDDAVKVAYEFYLQHPDETLIVVTADHETGGLGCDFGGDFKPERFTAAIRGQRCSGGELADQFSDWKKEKLSAEVITAKCLEAFGLSDAAPEDVRKLGEVVDTLLTAAKDDQRSKDLKKMYGSQNAAVAVCQGLIAKRCGVSWKSTNHTADKVPTTAVGPGSGAFAGDTDNTDIGRRLRDLLQ